LLLKFLPACIMVNSICLVVFIDIPCLCHFEPNDSICAYARDHQDILLHYLSGLDVFPIMILFSAIQTFIDCPSKSIQLARIWSEHLILIHRSGYHNTIVFMPQTIQMFLKSDAFALFLPLIEYCYSHQVRCGSPNPLLGYYPTVSFIFNHLVSSSPDT
jgi:hypothetical protein